MLTKVTNLWIRIMWGVNLTFAGLCALLVIAVYAPGIPHLGIFGTASIPAYAPWFIILPLMIEGLVLVRSNITARHGLRSEG
jgi:hypothetical protein